MTGSRPDGAALPVRAEVTVWEVGPDVPAGLLLHYDFDETGGSIARDSSGQVTLTGGCSSDTAAVPTGRGTAVTAAFGDPGTREPTPAPSTGRTALPTAGTVAGTTCRARHTYTKAGIHRPVITVKDDDGATDSTTLP